MIKIIVMMSTYNGEKYIDKQLDSIYKQTLLKNIELYIRDDGSKDDTLNIIEKWKEKLNIKLYKGNNIGPSKSFMELVKIVPIGDYYAFVDQDDIWDSEKLECAINELGTAKMPKLWFSNCRIISSEGIILKDKLKNKKPYITIISQLISGSAQGCSMVFNRALIEKVKKTEFKNIPMHDLLFMEYALIYGNVIYDENCYFSYRVHSENVVAKTGKSLFNNLIRKLKLIFFKENHHSISNFTEELIDKVGYLMDEETIIYLKNLVNSRKSIKSKLYIVNNKLTKSDLDKAVISYKIKVLTGII